MTTPHQSRDAMTLDVEGALMDARHVLKHWEGMPTHATAVRLAHAVIALHREVHECDTFHGNVKSQLDTLRRQATAADNDRDAAIAAKDAALSRIEELERECEALKAERDDARAVGLRVCRIAHDLVTVSGSGEYSAINAAREQLGLDVRDIATQLRDSEERARCSERASDSLTTTVAKLRALVERAAAIADEALSHAHGIPTIVDTLRDEIAAIREEAGGK